MYAPSAPATTGLDEPALSEGEALEVDGLALLVRVSPRRKRLGLTVERDGTVTLRVPPGCGAERATRFVQKSRVWLDDKLRLRHSRQQLHPVRTLRDGEIHRYLGRDHRLLYTDAPDRGVDDAPVAVRLVAGRLCLDRSLAGDRQRARKAVTAWYCRVGEQWVRGRLQPWAGRMEVPEPAIEVRDVGRRWGTYRPGNDGAGRMALHWAVFQLPIRLVDYVIAHELAHIRMGGHGPDYWRLLGRAIPECRLLKSELDELGRRVWMGDLDG